MSKPDYDLKISKRGDRYGTYAGAAWKNKAGGINIKINAGLSIQSGEDIDVTLWPKREGDDRGGRAPSGGGGGGGFPKDDYGDSGDIPFLTCADSDVPRWMREGVRCG